MIVVCLQGSSQDVRIFLQQKNLTLPYLGSPIYQGQFYLTPQATVQAVFWGRYLLLSGINQSWSLPKPAISINLELQVTVLSQNDSFLKFKIKHHQISKMIKLRKRTTL